jgi:hypothetical protein
MAWFAIVESKPLRSEKEPSKSNPMTTNILTISNALNAKSFIIRNQHSNASGLECELNRKGKKHESPSR